MDSITKLIQILVRICKCTVGDFQWVEGKVEPGIRTINSTLVERPKLELKSGCNVYW